MKEENVPLEKEKIGGPKTGAKNVLKMDAKDAPKAVAKNDRGKTAMTEEREILVNNPAAIRKNALHETTNQRAKEAITTKMAENPTLIRNTETATKTKGKGKGHEIGTEINAKNVQTIPTLGKTIARTMPKTRRPLKRKVSVVFYPNYSATNITLKMQTQRVHAQSGSL